MGIFKPDYLVTIGKEIVDVIGPPYLLIEEKFYIEGDLYSSDKYLQDKYFFLRLVNDYKNDNTKSMSIIRFIGNTLYYEYLQYRNVNSQKEEHHKLEFKIIDEIEYFFKDDYPTNYRNSQNENIKQCVFCGQEHGHGTGDGHRSSHCLHQVGAFQFPTIRFIKSFNGKIYDRESGYYVRSLNAVP